MIIAASTVAIVAIAAVIIVALLALIYLLPPRRPTAPVGLSWRWVQSIALIASRGASTQRRLPDVGLRTS
jgi:hypothetical protein